MPAKFQRDVIITLLLAVCTGNSPVPGEFPSQGQWRGALMFSLIWAWTNSWVNNWDAGDLLRHPAHYDVSAMLRHIITWLVCLSRWWFPQCMKNRAQICTIPGNLKNIPKCSHSHILQSQWRNCVVIIDTGLLNHFKYTTQLFSKLSLTQLTRMCIWIFINFIENYRHIICKTNLSNYLPFIHICFYSLCGISDASIIMTSQRRCHARDSQNHK